MKKLILSSALFMFFTVGLFAQHEHHHSQNMQVEKTANAMAKEGKTESFKVYGNCGMCERRIEGALKKVEGVYSADWDVDTKQLTVNYNPEVIQLKEIKQVVANAGHDSDEVRAKEEVYNNLPGCCQYERPVSNEGN
ncbi:MAG: hypothetical protein Kow0027_24900 [Saprospiraceae bacterium]